MGAREATPCSQVDIWRSAASETQQLEFKEAKTQYDTEKLFQYCVAIANEGGGTLLLGVSTASASRMDTTSKHGASPNFFFRLRSYASDSE
jgi:hypothetical protein